MVTTKRWSNLFLHESFATFLSFRATQQFVDDTGYVVIISLCCLSPN
jgi:aminopeptidase N